MVLMDEACGRAAVDGDKRATKADIGLVPVVIGVALGLVAGLPRVLLRL